MKRQRQPSQQTMAVLALCALRPTEWHYGLELAKATQLKSGSLYPILIRCADRGLLESRWLEPSQPGRPARHAYRITEGGLALVEAWRSLEGESGKEALA